MEVLGGTGKTLGEYKRHWEVTGAWSGGVIEPRVRSTELVWANGMTERVKGCWDSSWQELGTWALSVGSGEAGRHWVGMVITRFALIPWTGIALPWECLRAPPAPPRNCMGHGTNFRDRTQIRDVPWPARVSCPDQDLFLISWPETEWSAARGQRTEPHIVYLPQLAKDVKTSPSSGLEK